MVQKDIHRSHVLTLSESGKTKDTGWFLGSLLAIVQGCDRKAFFACSGNGNGSSWNNRGSNGNYWSSSLNSATNGRNLNFNSGGVNPQNNNNRFNGFAVRAVQHTLLTILLLYIMIYGTVTATATTRFVSGILRCEEAQVSEVLCKKMGSESKAEYGNALRGFVFQTLQASSIEMFYCGVSKEEGDICCNVSGPYRTSSVLQLHTWPIRENIHSRYIQLHQESWYSLWYRQDCGFLQEGESQLAAQVLRDALRHQRLLHAHSQKEAITDSDRYSHENGNAQCQQVFRKNMERYSGYGFLKMADRNNSYVGPKSQLCYRWGTGFMDRIGPSQVDASSGRRPWTSNRKSDESAVFECVSECLRSIHETSTEMQILWPICGRCCCCVGRSGMAVESCAGDTKVSESGIGIGTSYGQAGDNRGSSWNRVSWCLYQAIQNIYIESCLESYSEKDRRFRFQQALEATQEYQQLSRNISTYSIVQAAYANLLEKRNTTYRHIQ